MRALSLPWELTVWWAWQTSRRKMNTVNAIIAMERRRRNCLYRGIVEEGFPGEITPEINLKAFASEREENFQSCSSWSGWRAGRGVLRKGSPLVWLKYNVAEKGRRGDEEVWGLILEGLSVESRRRLLTGRAWSDLSANIGAVSREEAMGKFRREIKLE